MCNGFVKIPRSVVAMLLRDPSALQVFAYITSEAAWSKTRVLLNGKLVEVLPGQFVSSRSLIAGAVAISDKSVRTAIDRLEMCGLLSCKSTNKYTVYTLLNSDSYGNNSETTGQQLGQHESCDSPAMVASELPSEVPALYINNNNISKEKEEVRNKNIIPPISPQGEEDFSGISDLHPDARKAVEEFIANRKELKSPMTKRAITRLVNKLRKMFGNDFDAWQKSIDASIMHGWTDVYELKKETPKKEVPDYLKGVLL